MYLRCQECLEVFDDIRIARGHMDEELGDHPMDHPGFDVVTEEEAY